MDARPVEPIGYEDLYRAHYPRVVRLCCQQEVFVLRYQEGWAIAAVADALGVSVGSVKQHLFRAVRHLRLALGDHA